MTGSSIGGRMTASVSPTVGTKHTIKRFLWTGSNARLAPYRLSHQHLCPLRFSQDFTLPLPTFEDPGAEARRLPESHNWVCLDF